MSKYVSVRIQAAKSAQLKHDLDFENRPSYCDPDRKDENKIIKGSAYEEMKPVIRTKKKAVKDLYQVKTRRKFQRHMNPIKCGLISFSTEAIIVMGNEFEPYDQAALHFIKQFEQEYDCEVLSLVRHADEASPHYHFLLTNQSQGTGRPLRFSKGEMSRLQDLAGASFSHLGITRGKKIIERVEETAEKLGVNINDKKAWSEANINHKTVQLLHLTLLPDLIKRIRKKDDELKKLLSEISQQQKARQLEAQQLASQSLAQQLIQDHAQELDLEEINADYLSYLKAKLEEEGTSNTEFYYQPQIKYRIQQIEAEREAFRQEQEDGMGM